jgi:AAA15 family ATPase/GTPase
MKIMTIQIKNYKAFYGEHEFNVDGKNLFVYGENGSGKSSLYYALKDFFQSVVETINFEFILKQFCFNKVPIPFEVDTSKIKTDVFWSHLKKYKNDNPTKCGLSVNQKLR